MMSADLEKLNVCRNFIVERLNKGRYSTREACLVLGDLAAELLVSEDATDSLVDKFVSSFRDSIKYYRKGKLG